jgi:hypothetical protein
MRVLCLSLSAAVAGLVALSAQERVDQDVFWKIRQEATVNSQILQTVHVLTDRYGPRLTGSPNAKAAGEWAVEQMQAWGLRNGHLEPWDFNRPGWVNERLSAHIVSPVKDALVVEALGWTPGTSGTVRGAALPITLPSRPTRDQLATYLDGIKQSVKGRMVLVGPPRQVLVSFNAPSLRREDADVISQMNATPPAQAGPANNAGPAAQAQQQQQQQRDADRPLTGGQIEDQLNDFLVANGALVRINDAGREHGQIRAFNTRTYDPKRAITTVVMRNEDYGRIWRLLSGGPAGAAGAAARAQSVELEFEVVNTIYPEGRTSYNVVAEIPGTDRAEEVVMLGGHLDSWHAGTGATDNAVGCAVMMEAARILSAIGVRPRRTIRVALWTGEEQGLLGSQAYVREHFGTFENPKPGYETLAGYFNIDNGTGRARGMTVFGPPSAAAVLREATAPFRDLGVLGATSTRSRATGGSDHTSFNQAGLPGIWVMQDPIQYDTHTWHTNLDTFERIVEDDVKRSAMVIAAAVYHLAMREQVLPRFTKDEMPRGPRQAGTR